MLISLLLVHIVVLYVYYKIIPTEFVTYTHTQNLSIIDEFGINSLHQE